MMYIELDDLRQSYIVTKNEIRKFVRGKRFTLYAFLIIVIFSLITFLPYVFGNGLGDTPGEVISKYVPYIFLLVILAATLFSSVTVVSEFEERTALILFTRPIKKTTIFLGKMFGCIILETVMIVLFYLGMAAVSIIVAGSVPVEILSSLGLSILFVVATSGVSAFISSIMKKGSTCAILTFVFLLLILPIISGVIGASTSVDPWFMLDQAQGAIASSIPEYVENSNAMMEGIMGEFSGMLPPEFSDAFEGLIMKPADIPKTVGTMLGWGLVSMIMAWVAFIRREF